MIRILIVDDHKIIREGLRCILGGIPDFQVAADAGNGLAAIRLASQTESGLDLMITDIRMPEMDGIEVSRRILYESPQMKIIVLSMFSDRQLVEKSLKTGIKGYLLKGCSSRELQAAIRCVMKGNIYLSPMIAQDIVDNYIHTLRDEQTPSAPAVGHFER